MQGNLNRRRRGGNSVIEVTLMAPWIFFLFVGVLDFGFYAYSFISTENAARAAVLLTSKSKVAATDQADACAIVLQELAWAAYGRYFPPACNAAPLVVNATFVPMGTNNAPADSAQIEVQFTTVTMVPIPGALSNLFVIDRKWLMQIDPTTDF